MNQPNLGLKVSEIRQQNGLTQEQLAETCEISPRTIQRIESGEVDPRAYTLHCLGTALEFDFEEENTANENLWLTILHLSSMFCILIIPLLVWSWKKNQSYKIDKHGRQVLNFQITMTLVLFTFVFLLLLMPVSLTFLDAAREAVMGENPVLIPLVLFIVLALMLIGFFCTYQGAVNAARAMSDKPIHYPLSIPFIK